MSNYRYTLSDYNAIKEADIAINGITVLAGENGCGKVHCPVGFII